MNLGELTYAEQLLLASVAFGTILLTALIVLCIIWKRCWIHQLIWKDVKKKGMDDIICIRYPTDIYPSSVGIYRENILRSSPEEEIARIFSASPVKRDSTYSSMSENSSASVYELGNSPRHSSATCSPLTGTPNSPDSTSHLIQPMTSTSHGSPHKVIRSPNNNTSSSVTVLPEEEPEQEQEVVEVRSKVMDTELNDLQVQHPQPFFTFGLQYDQGSGSVHIDFLEARNLPWREYLNQASDPFFTLEIEPRKLGGGRKTSLGGGGGGYKTEMMRYRFVTKTLRKANDSICDFSEKFLAQLSKANLKDYKIRFTGFDADRYGNPTELGSTTLTFDDFRDFTSHKLILSCSLKEPIIKRGELLLGLCYLPTAERMSVNVMKVTNMNPYYSYGTITKQSICYVRVFLLRADNGKVIKRKKTTYQRIGTSADQPIFNETLVFDMPPSELIHTVLLVMVCLTDKIHGGSAVGGNSADHSPSPPSVSLLSAKRHSTPEHHLRPPEMHDPHFHHQRHSVDDALFHYGDNMNRCSRSSSGVFESISAGNSRRGSAEPSPTPTPTQGNTDTATRSKDHVVGKVAFGYNVRNSVTKAHWEKMIRAPRTIASEWHNLK